MTKKITFLKRVREIDKIAKERAKHTYGVPWEELPGIAKALVWADAEAEWNARRSKRGAR